MTSRALPFSPSLGQSYTTCFALRRFISHPWNHATLRLTALCFTTLQQGGKRAAPRGSKWPHPAPCSPVPYVWKALLNLTLLTGKDAARYWLRSHQQLKEVAFKTLNPGRNQALPPPATIWIYVQYWRLPAHRQQDKLARHRSLSCCPPAPPWLQPDQLQGPQLRSRRGGEAGWHGWTLGLPSHAACPGAASDLNWDQDTVFSWIWGPGWDT